MVKTTVYLEPEVVLNLKLLATIHGRSQAELIRAALAAYTQQMKRPPIKGIGEFDSGETSVSTRTKDILRQAATQGKFRRTLGSHR